MIEAIATTRDSISGKWGLIVRFADRDDGQKTIHLSYAQLISGSTVFEILGDLGFPIPASPTAQDRLRSQLLTVKPERRVSAVSRSGWHSDQFLLGDETIGTGTELMTVGASNQQHRHRFGRQDQLAEWKAHVADPSATSSYLVFGLCLTFAAPLLRLVHEGARRIDITGLSASHKAAYLGAVASVFGNRMPTDADSPLSSSMLDDAILAHSDLPLILDGDDPSAVDGAVIPEANLAGHEGATHGHDERLTTATLLIRVGGKLAIARTLPSDRQPGASIEVSVPEGEAGLFDRRPKNDANIRSQTLDRLIARNAAAYFGTAGEAYIRRLVAAVANDKQALIGRLEKRIGRFWTRVGAGAAEQSQRAQIFALAYAAGQLAIDYGVVPWRRSLVRRSIIHVYRATHPSPLKTDPISAAAENVLNRLMSPGEPVVDLTNRRRPINPKTAGKAPVLKVLHSDGLPLVAIQPAYFERLVGPTVSVQTVAQHLEQMGVLIPRGPGRRTRQVRIPGVTVRRGYYCLRLPSPATPPKKPNRQDPH